MTHFIKATIAGLVLLSASAQAHAVTQSDVKECRTVLSAQTDINMDNYRLRFEKEQGVRKRVLTFTVIPHSKKRGETRFEVSCAFNSKEVVAIYQDQTTLYAKNTRALTKPTG